MAESPFFYTWQSQAGAQAIEIVGGDGAFFVTQSGDRWLDLGSLSYQANLGHGHPRMVRAIVRQAQQMCLAPASATFAAKQELADELIGLAGSDFSTVFFTLSGAEAVENAMKIARLFTGRSKFLSRYRSYHGASFGALSLTGDYRRPPIGPTLGGVTRVLRDEDIPETLAREGGVAAVVLESIVGANGVLQTAPDTWNAVQDACHENEALLCLDEVLTGFGRTGAAFAFEHVGLKPDLICCAKGLTAGYAPLGAVLVHNRIADFFARETLWAGLTNYGHPLGCAAGLEAMRIYRDDGLFARAGGLGLSLLADMQSLVDEWPEVFSGARGRGLLAAVDVNLEDEQWPRFLEELARQRVHVHASPRRETLILAPPLIIEEADLEDGFERLRAVTRATLD